MSSTTLSPPLAAPPLNAAARPRPRRTPRLELSPDAYWLLAIVVVALYLVLWVTHFDYVYGWSTDDRTVFAKGIATVRDWKNAFSFFNALQPYFFVVSYLPLASGLTLPSIQIPWAANLT